MITSKGQVTFGNETITYDVIFHGNRRTLGIEVHPDKSILVKAPADCDDIVIASRIRQRAPWICKQIRHFELYSHRSSPRQYIPGETHLYLGRQYRLKIQEGAPSGMYHTRGHFVVTVPRKRGPEEVKAIIDGWYRERAKEIYEQVLLKCFPPFARRGHTRPKLAIRTMQKRWGSLSSSGILTLNSSLIRAPKYCIEYVVVHELCHLEHKNHGSLFTQRLEQLLPDWQTRKAKLEQSLL